MGIIIINHIIIYLHIDIVICTIVVIETVRVLGNYVIPIFGVCSCRV